MTAAQHKRSGMIDKTRVGAFASILFSPTSRDTTAVRIGEVKLVKEVQRYAQQVQDLDDDNGNDNRHSHDDDDDGGGSSGDSYGARCAYYGQMREEREKGLDANATSCASKELRTDGVPFNHYAHDAGGSARGSS